MTKTCRKCLKEKTVDSFALQMSRTRSYCRECVSIINKTYRSSHPGLRGGKSSLNPEYQARYNLLRKYGITPEQKNDILLKQGNACGICQSTSPGSGKWHLDHCHKTKAIRGVLCRACNVMLGMAKDNAEILVKAAQYLNCGLVYGLVNGRSLEEDEPSE